MHTMIKSNDHIVLLLRPEPSANSQIPLHLMSVESSMPSESTSRAYSTRTSHLLSLATSAGKYPAPGHTLISCRSIHGPRDPSVPVCTAFHEHKLIKLACLLINLFTHHAWAWPLRDTKKLWPFVMSWLIGAVCPVTKATAVCLRDEFSVGKQGANAGTKGTERWMDGSWFMNECQLVSSSLPFWWLSISWCLHTPLDPPKKLSSN